MDYVSMLDDLELLQGFLELLSDSDQIVVKRTVRCFTNVYRHALHYLTTGELDEKIYTNAWPSLKKIVHGIFDLVSRTENEGVLIQLVKFLECTLSAHLTEDLSKFPFFLEEGRSVFKGGLKALKNLLTTPNVSGCVYIVGIETLIHVACLKNDLWEPVVGLLKKQQHSLPPTMFDHNVRSLNKTLQRCLFHLLCKVDVPHLKEAVIDLMVSAGASRRMLAPWAPPPSEVRKRPLSLEKSSTIEDVITGRQGLSKKLCTEERSRSVTPPSVTGSEKQNNESSSKETSLLEENIHFKFLSSLIPKPRVSEEEAQRARMEKLFDQIMNILTLENTVLLVMEGLRMLPDTPPPSLSLLSNKNFRDFDIDALKKKAAAVLAQQIPDSEYDLRGSNDDSASASRSSSRSATPVNTEMAASVVPPAFRWVSEDSSPSASSSNCQLATPVNLETAASISSCTSVMNHVTTSAVETSLSSVPPAFSLSVSTSPHLTTRDTDLRKELFNQCLRDVDMRVTVNPRDPRQHISNDHKDNVPKEVQDSRVSKDPRLEVKLSPDDMFKQEKEVLRLAISQRTDPRLQKPSPDGCIKAQKGTSDRVSSDPRLQEAPRKRRTRTRFSDRDANDPGVFLAAHSAIGNGNPTVTLSVKQDRQNQDNTEVTPSHEPIVESQFGRVQDPIEVSRPQTSLLGSPPPPLLNFPVPQLNTMNSNVSFPFQNQMHVHQPLLICPFVNQQGNFYPRMF